MAPAIWHFRCRVGRVIDGDTLCLDAVDLGLGIHYTATPGGAIRIRLAGCDAYECQGPERAQGLAAKQFVKDWLAAAPDDPWPFRLWTVGQDNFGRWLGYLWYHTDAFEDHLAYHLITAGHAVPR